MAINPIEDIAMPAAKDILYKRLRLLPTSLPVTRSHVIRYIGDALITFECKGVAKLQASPTHVRAFPEERDE